MCVFGGIPLNTIVSGGKWRVTHVDHHHHHFFTLLLSEKRLRNGGDDKGHRRGTSFVAKMTESQLKINCYTAGQWTLLLIVTVVRL